MYTALQARIPFLDINQEREFAYAGYTGMVELARQHALTMESPVWEAVRKPAPWKKSEAPGVEITRQSCESNDCLRDVRIGRNRRFGRSSA
jgi:nitrogenase molybdenum-cofactor synthesis protein NifE